MAVARSRALYAAFALAALLCAQWASSSCFAHGARLAPQPRASKAADRAAGTSAVARQQALRDATLSDAALRLGVDEVAKRIESLRAESLAACLEATAERPEDVQRCTELSKELYSAEELLQFLKLLEGAGGFYDRDVSY